MKKFLLILVMLCTPVLSFAKNITFGEFLDHYTAIKEVPASAKYIDIEYTNIKQGTYEAQVLQRVVYLDLLPNTASKFPYYTVISEDVAVALLKKFEGLSFNANKGKTLTAESMKVMLDFVAAHESKNVEVSLGRQYEIAQNQEFAIMEDVYQKLIYQHYDNAHFDKRKLIQGAIKGMTEATNDQFTAYFPPVESKNFLDSVNGSFVGIGAYVEMPKPGHMIITAPLEGSPASRAGLQAGDIITIVDDQYVTEENTKEEVVSWIKGEPGTTVTLTILREGKTLRIPIIRELIVVDAVTSKVLDSNTLLVDINMFSQNMYEEFVKALLDNKVINKNRIIIDLTNNPGGALEEVVRVLNHFVPAGEPTVITKDLTSEDVYSAFEVPDALYLGDKQVIIMTNNGSASASEIMAGTIREYVKNSVLIGEKTYGKGSVQGLVEYFDHSLLKITIANWLTGKDRRLIDKIGIAPDMVVEDKIDTEVNEILEAAKAYRF